MICCKTFGISIAAITCSTEMVIDSVVNGTQDFPAFAGTPRWEFGSYVPGFGAASGSIQLTFRSPTIKTWRIGGAQFNASGTLVRGWQTSVFASPPTITIGGVAQSFDMVTIGSPSFWIFQGKGLEEGTTFQTNSCADVVVQVSGNVSGSAFGGRTLIEVEDITP